MRARAVRAGVAYGAANKPESRETSPVLASLAPLLILIVFAAVGILAGVAQLNMERWCPYCKLQVTWKVSTCPHCRCRLDDG
jgi:hypothetical protein